MGIKEEITKIAVEQGYEGAKPKSIAQAIDALTDTLAGEDVKSGRSVVGAVKALAPYIGGGGGTRVELFDGTVTTEGSDGMYRGLVLGNGTTADEVYVTFDGTEYELPRVQFPGGGDYGYGAFGETGPDFSTYPLMLSYSPEGEGWFVFTETAGTYTIAAYTVSSGGGGGTTLGELVEVGASPSGEFHVSTAPYDISGETAIDVGISIESTTNVCMAYTTDEILAPNGCYVAINSAVPVDWSTDSLGVYIGEEPVTSGFECRVLPDGVNHSTAFFTTQIPETDNGLYINFGIE